MNRSVYCLFGIPIDGLTLAETEQKLLACINTRQRCFLSTPNLNFLINAQYDSKFRDSVIHSDLSIADGMPLVWLGRLLGMPLPERVAGSTLFERLSKQSTIRLRVYFFGGPDGVAQSACEKINSISSGMECVGFQSPGFVTVEQMSHQAAIQSINNSAADFLVVSLGAKKGQEWIQRNLGQLNVPVITHLGAVVNFVAGTVHRAPNWMQKLGFEWLWRIYQEPALWKRYWTDGKGLVSLFVHRALPYATWLKVHVKDKENQVLEVESKEHDNIFEIIIRGWVDDQISTNLHEVLSLAAQSQRDVRFNLEEAYYLGYGFFGQTLHLKKILDAKGLRLIFTGVKHPLLRFFYWNCTEYLLEPRP